jgi:hypothetical protein
MKKFFVTALSLLVALLPLATPSAFAAGISASGGGSKVVGQNFTISVVASGAEFDSLQGTISVSGPISIVSFGAGSATWLPGKSPSNGNQFVGITSPTRSLTVASITLKGTKEGKGSVTVSGVRLARNGSYVGDSGGSASFTIGRAPTPPGTIEISSSTHPDQGTAYAATTLEIAWKAPSNGASGYSYGINEVADTAPEQKVTGTGTSAKYEGLTVGTHYFHIRAQNGDGWGPAAHFKVVIKEPDAKIDSALGLPSIMSVEKNRPVRHRYRDRYCPWVRCKRSGRHKWLHRQPRILAERPLASRALSGNRGQERHGRGWSHPDTNLHRHHNTTDGDPSC